MHARKPIHYLAAALHVSQHLAGIRRFDDGALLVTLDQGEKIVLTLFEQCPAKDYLEALLIRHRAEGLYSLFMLDGAWLSDEGLALARFEAVEQSLACYSRKIYVYKLFDEHLMILPVYRNALNGSQDSLYYGPPVHMGDFKCYWLEHEGQEWALAEFGFKQFWEPKRPPQQPYPRGQQTRHKTTVPPRKSDAAQVYYDILGLSHVANEAEVKQAYRQLAQLYHPDVNGSPEAKAQMQRINEAYRQIMRK